MHSTSSFHRPTEISPRELVARLQGIPDFADLSPHGLAAFARVAAPRSFRKGDEILAEGVPATSFFVMLDGRVKMVRALSNGRSALLALFGPGELFGTVAALGGQPCEATIVALERSLCLQVDQSDLMDLFEQRPRLVGEILPLLTRQMVECKNCLVEMTCYRVEMRFAQLLLKLADSVGSPEPEGTFIPVPLSRQELADMTGTTIETCIRVMSRWGKSGVVDTEKRGFLLRDRATLAMLAEV